jgi:hypothetical protein
MNDDVLTDEMVWAIMTYASMARYRDVEYLSNIIATEKRMPIPEMLSMIFEEDCSAQ